MENGTRDRTSAPSGRFTPIDYARITVLGFGLSGLWSSLHSIILPLRLLDFVPEALKNSRLGYLTFAGLGLAMLVQPVAGAASDRSGFAWGRRRPFVLAGMVATLVLLPGIGLWGGYVALLVVYCLLQVSGNVAQGPYQGFIPDLVPGGKRGVASGVKALMEVLGGITLVRLSAYFMGRYSPGEQSGWLWGALGAIGLVLAGTTLVTLLSVRERRGTGRAVFSDVRRSFQVDLRRNRPFAWFLASRFLLSIPGVILQTFALFYLMDVVGLPNPAEATGDLLIAVGGALLVAVYIAGRLSDRVGRRPVLLASGLVGALGVGLLFISRSYGELMLSGALIGLANGAILSASWALATDLAAVGSEARYLGITNLALAAGSALARLIGPVIDFFNALAVNLGYSVMLIVCLVCFVGGSLLLLKVGRPGEPLTAPASMSSSQ